ncbi:cytochrome c oxidase subunit NDUFA4-like [Symphalangus syndactylus]|uniref:cytochrome c oxidase subunit NDUFA4-like n=1 Tax=Symphalangus syndactylus TaxID=9590 RepID=UPI0024429CE1|nr:cytochrome c oxidase subunit NDUFA4-like [Symphalangus syndactylus]
MFFSEESDRARIHVLLVSDLQNAAGYHIQTQKSTSLRTQPRAWWLRWFFPFQSEASATNILRQIISQAKRHLSLIPLFVFTGAGGTRAALYLLCLALFHPDVSWNRKNNPEPWNKLGPNDLYKFYSVNVDYSKLKKEGPDF